MKAGDETIQINVDDFFGKRQEFAENATKAAVQQMTAAVVRNIGRCLLDIEKYRDAWAGEDFDSITMDFKLIVYHPSKTVVKFMGPQVSWAKRTKFVDDHVDAGTLIDADQPELPFEEKKEEEDTLAGVEVNRKMISKNLMDAFFWLEDDQLEKLSASDRMTAYMVFAYERLLYHYKTFYATFTHLGKWYLFRGGEKQNSIVCLARERLDEVVKTLEKENAIIYKAVTNVDPYSELVYFPSKMVFDTASLLVINAGLDIFSEDGIKRSYIALRNCMTLMPRYLNISWLYER